jgi:hypothetical protein
MLPDIAPIPKRLRTPYTRLRIALYLVAFFLIGSFIYRTLFPILEFPFDFRTPGSSKNTLTDPRSATGSLRENGKIESNGTLVADAAALGIFSTAAIQATLEKKSELPSTLHFSIQRSYRSFLLPTGPSISRPDEGTLYRVDDTYYALRDGTLHPFVSERAYLSRHRTPDALSVTKSLLSQFPISDDWIGFRVGSLVSFADGIFVIVSDTEMRPIGSAEIFLGLGYRFEDVISGSEEEIGIYKRGRIFLLGDTHPDGTLLLNTDTQEYFLVDQGSKRPVADQDYLSFLLDHVSPITVSGEASSLSASCDLMPSSFGRTFSCTTPVDTLTMGHGNDFEIHLNGSDTDIDINSLSLSLETGTNNRNMMTILSQIKQRLLSRFGAGNQ